MKTLTVEQARAAHEACMDRYYARGVITMENRPTFEECRNEDCMAAVASAPRSFAEAFASRRDK